jgi:phosphoribosylanthranilate isomerase
MTWIKICGITRLEDAQLAAGAGADAVGFIFADSPRRVDPGLAASIVTHLPPTLETVGVFVNERSSRIREIVTLAGLTAVQLHGDEPPGFAEQLFSEDEAGRPKVYRTLSMKTVYSAVNATAFLSAHKTKPVYAALLLDSGSPASGGAGVTFDWERARPFVAGLKRTANVIVAGGLTPENVGRAIEIFRPWGVDVASGVESAPGKKDPEKVRAFIAAVRKQE